MRRIREQQPATISAPVNFGYVDIDVTVVATDDGEAMLHVQDDARSLFHLASFTPECMLTFTDRGHTVGLRGYLQQAEWSTLRFGVSDGVTLPEPRVHSRLDTSVSIELRRHGMDDEEPVFETVTSDISRGGFSLANECLPAGSRYDVTLRLPAGPTIQGVCKVVRCHDGTLAMAWEHLSHDDGTRLAAFVIDCKKQRAIWG